MGAQLIKEGVYWVGVQDPGLRVFDIIMNTEHGTSYNAYLIKGSDKTALVETVKDGFYDEYRSNIESIIPLEQIDYLIVNHSEPDHSGSLVRLLESCPGLTVVAHHTALAFLKEICPRPFQSKLVSNRDSLDLGGKTLHFISAMLLHWPDTIYTYLEEDKILFSCDSFGCHYSDDRLFSDLIPGDFLYDYKYYFDHILSPFKTYVNQALNKLRHYPLDLICPGHGPILRDRIPYYLDLYREWAKPRDEFLPQRVVLAYVSAYGYTRSLADEIMQGLQAAGDFEILAYDLIEASINEVATAVDDAAGLLLGSPTLNKDALPPVWFLLSRLSPISHSGKLAAAFGSYGWSGEAVPNIEKRLHMLRMKVLPGLRVRFKPGEADLQEAFELGKKFGQLLLNPDQEAVEAQCLLPLFPTHTDLKVEDYSKRYANQDLAVYWNPDLCHHDTYCFTRLGSVFNPEARPWVKLEGDRPERIIKAINRCPSGALRYSFPPGSPLDREENKGPGYIKE